MSTHVYPYVFSFRERSSNGQTFPRTHVVLIESTRSRKKDWVLRAKDGWDNEWCTVINVPERFKAFMAASKYEQKGFEHKAKILEVYGVSKEMPANRYMMMREAMGGHLGYSYNTFFWNMMHFAFVEAIRKSHVFVLEDEVHNLTDHFTEKLEAIPSPDMIPGKPLDHDISSLSEAFQWQIEGLNYGFDYHAALEEALKPLNFKLICSF